MHLNLLQESLNDLQCNVDVCGGDIQMSYGAKGCGTEGNKKNTRGGQPFGESICIHSSGTYVEEDDVGYHLFRINYNSIYPLIDK